MKRFFPVFGFGVVLISVAVVLPLYLAGKQEKGGEWQSLPGGGEIRFHTVTYGSTHRVEYPRPGYGVLLQKAVTTRSLRPFFGNADWTETSFGGDGQSIKIWTAIRGRKGAPVSLSAGEMTLPDGQIFYTGSGGSSSRGATDFTLHHLWFQVLPYTAKHLRFAAKVEGKRYEWNIPNPTYREDVEEWTPEPLPQTREIGDFKVTLKELKLQPSGENTTQWRAVPTCSVFSSDGKDVGKWFSLGYTYCDAGGNKFYQCGLLSAPAWKVITRVDRTNAYPFSEEEVRWIGATSKSAQEAFGAGTYAMFPLDDVARDRGIIYAGLFGPGQYDIDKEGTVVHIGPPVKVDRQQVWPIKWDYETKITRASLDKPAFLILSGSRRGVSVFRDQSDRPVYLKESWSHGSEMGLLRIYSFPKDMVRFGVADSDLPSSSTQDVEFIVQPPAIPPEKEAPRKR